VLDTAGKTAGTQPLRIRVIDPSGEESQYSDYYATSEGVFTLEIKPALNDRPGVWKIEATDLTSGLAGNAVFEMK
jgi:uncharacterized protein YfaS (alpha-2-macroglobulin family)